MRTRWSTLAVLIVLVCAVYISAVVTSVGKDEPFLQDSAMIFTFSQARPTADWINLPQIQSVNQSISLHSPSSGSSFLLNSPQNGLFLLTSSGSVQSLNQILSTPISSSSRLGSYIKGSATAEFAYVTPQGQIYLCSPSLDTACDAVKGINPTLFGGWIGAVAYDYDGSIWIGSENGLFYFSRSDRIVGLVPVVNESVNAIVVPTKGTQLEGYVFVGTNSKMWFYDGVRWQYYWTPGIIDDSIVAMELVNEQLWIGNDVCINRMNSNMTLDRIGGVEGLPYSNITSIASLQIAEGALKSVVWMGSLKGAFRYDPNSEMAKVGVGKWKYYYGSRWLPSTSTNDGSPGSQVLSVAAGVDANGREVALLISDVGMSMIYWREWTLDLKAKHYQATINPRHNRYGLVSGCHLRSFGNLSSYQLESDDNDGLWTSMYLGSQCFRYQAEGKNPEIKAQAWKHFEALEFLNNVTGIEGLMARSVLKSGPPPPGHWHNSTVYPGWMWKGDTSSDEVDGHLFVYPLVYDLLAETPEEKARAKRLICGITKYIVDNDFYLIDITGKPTTWGKWNPTWVNDRADWYDDRGVNSMQILSWLLSAAKHCPQDGLSTYFTNAFLNLTQNYGYAMNIVDLKITQPSDDNYSDDELTYLAYFTYIWAGSFRMKKEFDLSITRTTRIVWSEKAPLWQYIYAASQDPSGLKFDLEGTIWSLHNWPLSLISWPVKNSERLDIFINPDVGREGNRQSLRLLPWDERNFFVWNSNPFDLDGGSGNSEETPTGWLLPYWMARYFKFIV